MLMRVAQEISERGTCSRLKVGALVHREGRILSTGYNGAPAKVDHCDHECTCHSHARYWEDLVLQDHYIDCASQKPCITALHAERNAIDWAARYGTALHEAEMVTTDTPCQQCAGSIINSGIVSVISLRAYRDQTGVNWLRQAGISMSLYEDVR